MMGDRLEKLRKEGQTKMRKRWTKKIAAALLSVMLGASLLSQNVLAVELEETTLGTEVEETISQAESEETALQSEETTAEPKELEETGQTEKIDNNEDITTETETKEAMQMEEEAEGAEQQEVSEKGDTIAATVSKPRIKADSSMAAGQNVTWDCIYMGSYPQTEVKKEDAVYAELKNATGWDGNNDITISGQKYRRMTKEDATLSRYSGKGGYYNWEADDAVYHYFKYEPIKWRVLDVDGNNALVLADIALDDQKYHSSFSKVTWENCTIRSWLNQNFLQTAFSSEENEAIALTQLDNANNPYYGTDAGNDTQDKIFFLKATDAYTTKAKATTYGFVKIYRVYDEARRCKSSDYAKAMGIRTEELATTYGNCFWWIRTPGEINRTAICVKPDGWFGRNGYGVADDYVGVRPAFILDLNKTGAYKNAGTVNSKDVVPTNPPICNHKFSEKVTKATPSEDGLLVKTCEACGYMMQETLYSPEEIKLSTEVYVYTGAVKNPKITVQDRYGNTIASSNYKVTYEGDRKSIGKHKVKIKYTGKYYAGERSTSFVINPKAVSLSSVKTTKSGSFTATWKKGSNITGYELQYSTKSSFSGATTKYINSSSTLTRVVTGLTKGKKYYVRVRCFKKVGTPRFCSDWSKVKTITVK